MNLNIDCLIPSRHLRTWISAKSICWRVWSKANNNLYAKSFTFTQKPLATRFCFGVCKMSILYCLIIDNNHSLTIFWDDRDTFLQFETSLRLEDWHLCKYQARREPLNMSQEDYKTTEPLKYCSFICKTLSCQVYTFALSVISLSGGIIINFSDIIIIISWFWNYGK